MIGPHYSLPVLFLYNSYLILRPALGEVMDEQLYDDLILEIREKSLEVNGILDTEKCFVRKSGMKFHVDLHAIVNGEISVKAGHDIAHELKDHLRKSNTEFGTRTDSHRTECVTRQATKLVVMAQSIIFCEV